MSGPVARTAEVSVTPMHLTDAMDVARLHRTCLLQGFLSTLPLECLATLYRGIANAPKAWVFLARESEDGKPLGFVSGSADTKRCYRHTLIHRGLELAWKGIPSLLDRDALRHSLETLVYPFRSRGSESAVGPQLAEALSLRAELLSIGVTEEARGLGVGRRLVEHLESSMCSMGSTPRYRVVTDSENTVSLAFYRRLGFREAGEFLHHGIPATVLTKTPTAAGQRSPFD